MGIKILRIAMLLMLLTALFAFAGAEELFTDEDGFQWVITGEETAQIMGINRDVTGDLDIPWGVYDSDENWYEVTSIAEGAFAGCNMEMLYIGNNITEIGDEAFKGCENLLEVSFMANVLWIPTSCFEGCTALEGIYVGTELDGIGTRAFYGCSSLTGLELTSSTYDPDFVPSVGISAFENCTSLEYVRLNNYWGEIRERAFAGCTSLLDVESDGTDHFADYVFSGCTNLVEVLISSQRYGFFQEHTFEGCENLTLYVYSGSEAENLAKEYGIPYETIDLVDEETGLIYQIDEGMGHAVILGCTDSVSGKVTIPSELDGYEVCEIAFNAFIWEENITEIVIPETVISIGGGAFANSSITSVQLPPYVEDVGTGMFAYCNNLTRVVCPYEMIEMGRDMFRGCTSLTEVDMPELVQIIHPYTFAECTSLEELYLPPTLIDIYESAFSDCESLTLQVYSNTEGYWFAKEYEFPYELLDETDSATGLVYGLHDGEVMILGYNGEDCSNLVIPTEIAGYPVTSIGSNAFSGMPVASVVLPEGLTYIDYGAFSETLLTSVVLPSTLEDMQGAVFSSCELLTDVTLTGNMEWLPYCTFEYCTSLKEITIPEGIIYVDEMAFIGCTALEKIYLPVSVDEICDSALPENENLVLYVYSDSYAHMYARENGYNYEIVGQAPADASEYLTYEISEDGEVTITGIDETFSGELVIPDEIDGMIVAAIGENAFADNTGITRVTLPETLENLNHWPFSGCKALEEVVIPASVAIDYDSYLEIGDVVLAVYNNSSALEYARSEYVKFRVINPVTDAATGLVYAVSSGEAIVVGYNENLDAELVIPETLSGNEVCEIAVSAFEGCKVLTSVVVPNCIYEVHEAAFKNCVNLKAVDFTASILWIREETFYGCSSLEEISLTNGGEAAPGIEASAFENCTSLKNVIIHNEWADFGERAFANCTVLESFTFADGGCVRTLLDEVFLNCTSLKELYLNEDQWGFYESTFSGCINLTLKVVDGSSAMECAEEYGIPYEVVNVTDASGLVYYTEYGRAYITGYTNALSGDLVIPTELDGCKVIKISDFAFENAPITSVVIPDGIRNIGYGAFSGSSIESARLPEVLNYIDGSAFINCVHLTDINIPATISGLSLCMFEGCTSLEEIVVPEGISYISSYAFKNCTALRNVYLPDSVGFFDNEVFSGCENLTLYVVEDSCSMDYAIENSIPYEVISPSTQDGIVYYVRGDEAYIIGSTDDLPEDVVIPSTLNGCTVVSVGSNAFYESQARSIIIPEGVKKMGSYVFANSTVESVTLPESLTSMEEGVFDSCESLVSVNIPAALKHLPMETFRYCTSLKEIVLPEGFESIDVSAFYGCPALEKVVLPASMNDIHIYAFDECPNVTLYVNADSKALEYAQNYGLDYVIVDGEQTTPLDHFTFEFDGNTMAMKVTDFDSDYTGAVVIPDSYDDSMVSTIGANAFADCTGITEVTIPSYLYIIEANAFNNCTALEKVTFYSMEATIDDSAFAGCSSALTFYAYPYSDAAKYAEVRGINIVYLEREDEEGEGGGSEGYEEFEENGFTYILNYTPANEYTDQYIPGAMITGYNGTINGELVIPATIGGEEVAGVFETAFCNREDITSVTIPDSVNYVLMCAFEGCPNLKTIDVQAKYIQFGAFRKCTALESADISNAKEIHNSAFSGCTALKTVSLGFCGAEEYGYIGSYAFENCSALETVVLPEKSEWYSINEYAFAGCTSLKSANFYELHEISDCAFYNCSSLESFHLSRLVYWIGEDAFYGCDKLTLQLYSGTEGLEYALNNNVPFVLLDILDEASGLRYVIEDGQAILLSCEMPEQRAVTVPAELGGYPVYYIGRDVFMGESNLTSITISEGITEIESSAFASCGNLTSVYLPDSMANRLPSFLFSYCRSLTDVRLPEGNTMIPMGFFSNCGFTEFTVPDGVTSIGDCVFEMCTSLTKLTIPASVESIGWDLFYGVGAAPTICVVEGSYAHTWAQNQGYTVEFIVTEDPNATPASNFEYTVSDEGATITGFNSEYEDDIVIPATLGGKPVVAIGARAFQGYYGGDSIIIPATVTSVGDYAFWDSSLYMATFLGSECAIGYDLFDSPEWSFIRAPKDSDPIAYAIENGIPYGYPTDEPENGFEYLTSGDYSYVTGYDGTPSGDLVIPETLGGKPVKAIFKNAFKGCTEITSVYIPDCVVDMYESAFEGCTGLKSVRFPNGAMEMSDRVFYGCTSLEEVDLTNTQSEIYDYSFYGCTSLKTVKMNIGCDDGGRAYSVYDSAFEGCTALEEVIFPENADWADFGTRAFANCVNLVAFDADNNAEIYGYYDEAFLNCAKLESLDIQFNFWELGEDVFKGCDSLTLKVYYNSTAMEYAVENNIPYILKDKLTDDGLYYFIDRGEATITGAPAFEGDALVIPATIEGYSVSTIGESAFEGMNFKTVVMPSCIDDVGYYAFADCTELTEITLAPAYYDGYCFSGCTSLKSVTFPEGTHESLREGTFMNCTSLESVHLASTIDALISEAFSGCTSLKEVTGTVNLDHIYENVFYGCTSLTRLFLPECLSSLSIDAFTGCDNLVLQVVEDSYAHYMCKNNKLPYELIGTSVENGIVYYTVNNVAYINGYTEDLPADLVIPAELGGCAVRSIGGRVFENAPVDSIVVSEGIERIDSYAFTGCTAQSVELPDSLTSMSYGVFSSCAELTEVNIPAGIKVLQSEMFMDCTSLEEIVIPEGIMEIYSGAFNGCTALTSVTLPDRMEWISTYVFADCTSLESIDLPDGLTSIEDELFHHCISLKEIVIPDGVKSIWYDAFKNCPALVKVVIPESVDNILDNPFEDSASVVLHVYEGSYAHKWAVENGMSFELIKVVEATDFTGVPEMIYLPAGVSFTVKLGVLPEGAEMPEVSYRTLDETVASVTADGVITTVAKGNTAVSISGGGVTKLLNISVDDMDVMTLPKAMKVIDEEAFADSASIRILDLRASEGVEIAKNAFSGNFKLRAVLLPENAVIDSAAFTESEMTVFLCATDAQYRQMTALGYDAVMLK